MPKVFIAILSFFIFSIGCNAYSGRKAILLVNRNLQQDSIGYNMVDELSRVIYAGLQNESINLWDGPLKKHRINKEKLADNEKASGVNFTRPRDIFIYEKWSLKKNQYSFETDGISFSALNPEGKEVYLGYIENNDSLTKLFSRSLLFVNAEGSYGTTLSQALESRNFDFDLVFFKNKAIHKFKKGLKIKNSALAAKNTVYKNKVVDAKLVEYAIEPGPSVLSENSGAIVNSVESFFNDNPQEFYNYGGDRMFSFLKKTPFIFTSLNVTELWTIPNDTVQCATLEYIPFVIGKPISPIPPAQLSAWKLKTKGNDIVEEIRAKNYYYRITKINASIIDPGVAEKCKLKLLSKDWHNIYKELKPAYNAQK
jgi:hypothetical protein